MARWYYDGRTHCGNFQERCPTNAGLPSGMGSHYLYLICNCRSVEVRVYPNPTIGILNIESESEIQIFLYDLSGKLKIKTSQPLGSGQIDLSDFPAGIYVLEVSDKTGRKKVLKIEKVE